MMPHIYKLNINELGGNDHFLPGFMESKKIDLSIATSDYCQARCTSCIWPYMTKKNSVLSVEDFKGILAKFSGFSIGELTLNIINEPFTDKTIIKKLDVISETRQSVGVLFFSSNWLIPSPTDLDSFTHAIQKCVDNPNIGKIHLNATISGINEHTYDIQQAGANLVGAVIPYHELDFNKAVANIRGAISRLSRVRGVEKIRFRIKAYGDAFTEAEMKSFWRQELSSSDVPPDFIKQHVKIVLNQGYTTFARSINEQGTALVGRCARNWLDWRLVIGPQGNIGLCCEDGLNSVVVGNILDQELAEVITNESFQINLAKVTRRYQANIGDPCHRCSFFEVK